MSEPHSAHAFGESRDHWWNRDFVQLLARRWGLAGVRRGLDVGSGVGHWSRLLLSVMDPEATFVGVEPEARWRAAATERTRAAGLSERVRYVSGAAESIPFDDASFDLVTCQTVLMHVADPEVALREMWRVLAPGGLLLATEPNNLAGMLVRSSIDVDRPLDEVVADVRGELIRQRGKVLSGDGDDSVGDRVPSLFHALGVQELQVYVSDKTWTMLPPYADPLARAELDELREAVREGRTYFTRGDMRRWFLAGGGDEVYFDRWWARTLARDRRIVAAADAGHFQSPGAGIQYVVSGRKPK